MSYYVQRLEFVLQLFREHKSDLLTANQDKIRRLLEEYKKFKDESSYNPSLPSTIETFIL